MSSSKREGPIHRSSDELDHLGIEEHGDSEQHSFLDYGYPTPSTKSRVGTFSKIMAIVNLVLGISLAVSLALVARTARMACTYSVPAIEAPYSPALEAVVPVIRKFKPDLIFQSPPSDEVEAAWNKTLGLHDGLVAISAEDSARLAKTNHLSAESPWEPGKHIYGISMYHQLHCLNTIRKSFYRERFFADIAEDRFQFHKNHCFGFLRQAIMCHGDLSMTYWWDKSYSTAASNGTEVLSEKFLSMTLEQRAKGSSVYWDIEHQCRQFEPIDKWANEHPVFPAGVDPEADTGN